MTPIIGIQDFNYRTEGDLLDRSLTAKRYTVEDPEMPSVRGQVATGLVLHLPKGGHRAFLPIWPLAHKIREQIQVAVEKKGDESQKVCRMDAETFFLNVE